jgi:hypothetical protein
VSKISAPSAGAPRSSSTTSLANGGLVERAPPILVSGASFYAAVDVFAANAKQSKTRSR